MLSDLLAEALKLHRDTAETIVSVVSETPTGQQTRNEMIRLGKRGLTVPSGQICQVKCHIRGWLEEGTMLFEPALKGDVPDGLDLFPALVNVPPGASKTVKIPVCNSTKHDIFLPPRMDGLGLHRRNHRQQANRFWSPLSAVRAVKY